ncbi:MAG TPA: hypothetical protein VGV89_07125 [Thermoplasmata archaeon]|nr:hypothetical protein [Thermoplasmata archaeon]
MTRQPTRDQSAREEERLRPPGVSMVEALGEHANELVGSAPGVTWAEQAAAAAAADSDVCIGCARPAYLEGGVVTFTVEISARPSDGGFAIRPRVAGPLSIGHSCWMTPPAGILRSAAEFPWRTPAPANYGCLVLCTEPIAWPKRYRRTAGNGRRRRITLCPGCHGTTHVYLVPDDVTPYAKSMMGAAGVEYGA